jgi:hypothetical protein
MKVADLKDVYILCHVHNMFTIRRFEKNDNLNLSLTKIGSRLI